MRRAAVLLLAAAACTGAPDDPADAGLPDDEPAFAVCASTYAAPAVAGSLGDDELIEASGLAASRRTPGVLWSHNDSGDSARLFALRDDGAPLLQLRLPGVDAVDFEDLSIADCPDDSGPCLYVGDVGDNFRARDDQIVYAMPEPALDVDAEYRVEDAAQVWRFPVHLAEDHVNVEAFAVLPDLSAMVFLEKRNDDGVRIMLYRAPWTEGEDAALEVAGRFDSPGPVFVDDGQLITAIDVHPSGARLALRTYTGVFEYRFGDGQGVADMGDVEPVLVVAGPDSEPQGEAIAYDAEGDGLFTVSEDPFGRPGQDLHRYACEDE